LFSKNRKDFLQHTYTYACCDQIKNYGNKKEREQYPGVTNNQTQDSPTATGDAHYPGPSQSSVTGHNASQPKSKWQEIQAGGAQGAQTGRRGGQEQADGQVEAPLQEIEKPTQNSEREAGSCKLIANRSCIHAGWIGGILEWEELFHHRPG
jgi:hypothetical protein